MLPHHFDVSLEHNVVQLIYFVPLDMLHHSVVVARGSHMHMRCLLSNLYVSFVYTYLTCKVKDRVKIRVHIRNVTVHDRIDARGRNVVGHVPKVYLPLTCSEGRDTIGTLLDNAS